MSLTNFVTIFGRFVILVVVLLTSHAAMAQEPLTNEKIVMMVKAGLTEEVLIESIRSHPAKYQLDPDSLIKLHRDGVPGPVLSAMIAKQRQDSTVPRDVSSSSGRSARATETYREGVWEIANAIDPISGKRPFSATMYQPSLVQGQRVGEFRVTATCDDESLDFKIGFESDSQPGYGFKQNTEGAALVPNGLLGALVMAKRHGKPWVEMRVRIGQRQATLVSSEDDYLNQATVSFDQQPISNVTRSLAPDKWAGQTADALAANSILVELPLANGNNSILEIRPEEASFKPIALRCGSLSNNPVSASSRSPYPATSQRSADVKADIYARFAKQFDEAPANLQYRGTAEGFGTVLPAFFQRAAIATNRDPAKYKQEISFISEVAQKCFEVTPEMMQRMRNSDSVYVRSLDFASRVCMAGGGLATRQPRNLNSSEQPTDVSIVIRPRGDLADGRGYILKVEFSQRDAHNFPIYTPIVWANIERAQ